MGSRYLTVSKMSFHRKHARGEKQRYAPADLNGKNLADIFSSFLRDLGKNKENSDEEQKLGINDEERETWINVVEVERWTDWVVVVKLQVGDYGEPGDLMEVYSGKKVGYIEKNQAPTRENRVLLFVPESGEYAYFFAESSNRGSAGSIVLKKFKSYFSEKISSITMETATVTESEVWATGAKLAEVEVRVIGKSSDIADGLKVEVGTLSYIARPNKKLTRFFSHDLLENLRKEEALKRLFVIPDLPEDRQVYVTMKDEKSGRQKKYKLDEESAPNIREVLNASNQSPLDTAELVARCEERVSELCKRMGATWDPAWSKRM